MCALLSAHLANVIKTGKPSADIVSHDILGSQGSPVAEDGGQPTQAHKYVCTSGFESHRAKWKLTEPERRQVCAKIPWGRTHSLVHPFLHCNHRPVI